MHHGLNDVLLKQLINNTNNTMGIITLLDETTAQVYIGTPHLLDSEKYSAFTPTITPLFPHF